MKYLIQFGSAPNSTQKLWYGRSWRPYAQKTSAVRLPSRDAAQERLTNLRGIWDKNPEFARYLIEGAQIIEVEK